MRSILRVRDNDQSSSAPRTLRPYVKRAASWDQTAAPAGAAVPGGRVPPVPGSWNMLQLQRMVGNGAVNRLIAESRPHHDLPRKQEDGRDGSLPGTGQPAAHLEQQRPAIRTASPSAVQRQTAHQAGLLGNYTAGPEAALYNVPDAINLKSGIVYRRTLAPASTTQEVMTAYMEEVGEVGATVTDVDFLDKSGLLQMPDKQTFNDKQKANTRKNYLTNMRGLAKLKPKVEELANWTYDETSAFVKSFREDRERLRGIGDIELVDPFILELTIPPPHAQDMPVNPSLAWVFQTNFSDSAFGYITRIRIGPKDVTGQIKPDTEFSGIKGQPLSPEEFSYSNIHDTAEEPTVGEQIDAINREGTNEENNPGFDAVTKLAAEGARFRPVRKLGLSLRVGSRFYAAVPGTPTLAKFLTFPLLYGRWHRWFGRGYQITAADVKAQVLTRPQAGTLQLPADPVPGDYDLDTDAPVQ